MALLQFVEKHADGSSTVRPQRSEDREALRHEATRQRLIDDRMSRLQQQYEAAHPGAYWRAHTGVYWRSSRCSLALQHLLVGA